MLNIINDILSSVIASYYMTFVMFLYMCSLYV